MGLGRLFKLLLWLQFIRQGMISSFLRYFGVVWLAAGLVIGASLAIMLSSPRYLAAPTGPVWLMLTVCAVLIPIAYLVTRFLGPAPVVAICVAFPGMFIITPRMAGSANVAIESRGDDGLISGDSIIATGDLGLFAKGAFVSSAMLAFSHLVFRLAQVPMMTGKWSLRWGTTLAIVLIGIVMLELLRDLAGVFPSLRMPWHWLFARLREPGWPKAICVWIWLDIALLLAMYEDRLIPYLLHRTGHQWVPSRVTLQDVFMIDSLVSALADFRKKGDGRERSRQSSSRRSRHRSD